MYFRVNLYYMSSPLGHAHFRRVLLFLLLTAIPTQARLTKFIVDQGRFEGELDPKDKHNAIITDLNLAPRNAKGMVEYSATFSMLKPAQLSGVLYYSVPNRGNGTPNATPDGRVSVISGWQGDVTPAHNRQTITVPVAGPSITGPVIERLINTSNLTLNTAQYVALAYQRPATLDTTQATLRRNGQIVPPADWAFDGPTKITIKGGADPNSEYIIQYTAKDPLLLGVGFAATRDLISFLRYAEKDDAGNPNPVAHQIRWAIAQGNSQSGNFIRSFINLGFNQDEQNRIVWDGVNPHIAARQLALNFRFANPGGAAGLYEPGSEGALWWSKHDGTSLLDRCNATKTCPKIMETFGELEFWYLRESPNLVGKDAKADIPLPANVRRYYFPGTGHGGGRGGFSATPPAPPNGCVLPANPNPEADTMRALDAALIDWVTKGTEPPPSRYPTLAKGELVRGNDLVNTVLDNDFGPGFIAKDMSGVISKEPPVVRKVFPTLVPTEGATGVPSVLYQAPLGTYLGWNTVAGGVDKGKICGLAGGYKPFTRAELEQRYKTHKGYVEAVKKAAEQSVRDRFLLRTDADKLIQQAEASDVLNRDTRFSSASGRWCKTTEPDTSSTCNTL